VVGTKEKEPQRTLVVHAQKAGYFAGVNTNAKKKVNVRESQPQREKNDNGPMEEVEEFQKGIFITSYKENTRRNGRRKLGREVAQLSIAYRKNNGGGAGPVRASGTDLVKKKKTGGGEIKGEKGTKRGTSHKKKWRDGIGGENHGAEDSHGQGRWLLLDPRHLWEQESKVEDKRVSTRWGGGGGVWYREN